MIKGHTSRTFRTLFLGAGFSQPAGLPLGRELFAEVRRLLRTKYGADNQVTKDLARYMHFVSACNGVRLEVEDVNYEEFLSFLDVEHVLRLKGKDTWNSEGNRSQLMVKHTIANVLYERMPTHVPPLYRKFARQLNPFDYVYTFNYDTMLERALDAERIPYRLFPERYSAIGPLSGTVDNSRDEVVVIKLHGSIDWCDRSIYEKEVAITAALPTPGKVPHALFGDNPVVQSKPITDGPRHGDDSLANVYRVRDIEPLLERGFWEWCPLLLPPSHTKILYAEPVRDLWWGLNDIGGRNLPLAIVGYSLPTYDNYARQVFFSVLSKYTDFEPYLTPANPNKTPIRILDRASDGDSGARIRASYGFADWSRIELCLDGLNEASVDWLFA